MEWYYWVLLYIVIGFIGSSIVFAMCEYPDRDDRTMAKVTFGLWPIVILALLCVGVAALFANGTERLGKKMRRKFMQFKRKRDEAKQAKKRAAELKALKAETEDC